MLHRFRVVLAVLFIAAVVSCARDALDRDIAGVKQALQRQYPGAQFEVGFVGGLHHLELTVDTAVYGHYRLDDSQRRALAEEMARIAVEHLGAMPELDSLTVEFIQERSGSLLSNSWSTIKETLALADLR